MNPLASFPLFLARRTTGHTSTQTVRGYIDDGELFSDPASKYLGL